MVAESLSGLNILLVRPRESSGDFSGQVQAEGATLYHYPVMSLVPLNNSNIGQVLSCLSSFDKAIFVSRTAVMQAVVRMRELGLSWPNSLSAYAVGSSTAALLAKNGIVSETPELAMTSEGLLELASLDSIASHKIIVFCGAGGRTLLVDELSRRGALVQRCELYRRQLAIEEKSEIITALTEQKVNMLVAHSGELLQNLLSLLPEALHRKLFCLPILVPGERVARMAKEAGFSVVVTANSAIAEQMVSVLGEWYSSH